MKKIKIPLKKTLHCPFCNRIITTARGELKSSGNYAISIKCLCGFKLKKTIYRSEDKFDYAIQTLVREFESTSRNIKRKNSEHNFELTEAQKLNAIYNKAKLETMQEKVDEYNATGKFSKKF